MNKFELEPVKIVKEGISYERLDGEVVVISMLTGKYFSLDNVASDIFWLIENCIDQEIWAPILEKSYKDFDGVGINEFIHLGMDVGIFINTDEQFGNKSGSLPNDCERGSWTKPVLTVFDDLQDLLMIDPIHDASVEGWPKVRDEQAEG
jgi:hypothetical protein